MTNSLNDTLEEEQRVIICEQQKEINNLRQSIVHLRDMIAVENEAKYRAYVKIADLQKEQYGRQETST
jgi:Flp pilus assembly CpaF family ATPase